MAGDDCGCGGKGVILPPRYEYEVAFPSGQIEQFGDDIDRAKGYQRHNRAQGAVLRQKRIRQEGLQPGP